MIKRTRQVERALQIGDRGHVPSGDSLIERTRRVEHVLQSGDRRHVPIVDVLVEQGCLPERVSQGEGAFHIWTVHCADDQGGTTIEVSTSVAELEGSPGYNIKDVLLVTFIVECKPSERPSDYKDVSPDISKDVRGC